MTYNSFKILFVILTLAIAFLGWQGAISWLWIIVIILLGLAIISYGSATLQSNFFTPTFSKLKEQNKLILTFDDGPHPNTLSILEVLKKHQATATFFCIGKNAQQHPEILQQIITDGHNIGNHTQNHSNKWGWMRSKEVRFEIQEASKNLEKLSEKPIHFFRPPFGVTNPRIAKVLKTLPLKIIGWDLRSLDTAIKNPEKLWHRIEPKLASSSIILFHDTQEQTVEVLEKTLDYCKSHGIKIVSLADKIETPSYA